MSFYGKTKYRDAISVSSSLLRTMSGRSSLASKDGPEFEARFLQKMVQQDKNGRKKAQICLAQASQKEILFFCHEVERSRWLELALLRNQLCQRQKHCSFVLFEE